MKTRTYGRIKPPAALPAGYRCEYTDGHVFFPSVAGSNMAGLLPSARMVAASNAARRYGQWTGRRLAAVTEVR